MSKKLSPVVFAGVRSIQTAQFPVIDEVLNDLKANTFITGCAPGVDTYTCIGAVRSFPGARHIVVVPWRYALGDVHIAWCLQQAEAGVNIEVLDMPEPKRKDQHPNLYRNEYMLELATKLNKSKKLPRLIAFPGGQYPVQRSGTWSTIRRAESSRFGEFDIQLHPLSLAQGSVIGGQTEI
jgi:hypothetical protein